MTFGTHSLIWLATAPMVEMAAQVDDDGGTVYIGDHVSLIASMVVVA